MKDTRPVPHQTLFYGLLERSLSQGEQPPFDFRRACAWDCIDCRCGLRSTLSIPQIRFGGNSGSPVVDRDGKVVGLNFDSNIEKLPNRYYYVPDAAGGRAVAVRSVAILAALGALFMMRLRWQTSSSEIILRSSHQRWLRYNVAQAVQENEGVVPCKPVCAFGQPL